MNKKILLQSTIAVLGLETAIQAQTWDFGAATQAWTDADNWNPNGVPTTGVVTINTATAGQTPIITTAVDRKGGDTFIGNGGAGVAGVLDINNGGSVDTSSKWIFIGNGTAGNGTLNVNSGGSLITDNDIRLAATSGSTGNLNINGGTVTAARVVNIGTGTVTVSNGGKLKTTAVGTANGSPNIQRLRTTSFTAGSSVEAAVDARYVAGNSSIDGGSVTAAAQVIVGNGVATTLAMSAGTLQSGAWMVVGIGTGGSGTINLSGGAVKSSLTSGFTTVGANNNAIGVIHQTNGTWTETSRIVLGEGGTAQGTYTLDSGTLTSPLIEIARGATNIGTFTMNGGDLYTGQIAKGAGTANINLNGGTVHATADSSNFITGNTNVGGGLTIDSQAFNVSIGGNLTGTGNLTKTGNGSVTLAGASNSLGAVTVSAGSLFVNGALGATSVSVASGGLLGGTGTVGASITAASGSRIGAGNSIGTMNVTGDLTVNGAMDVEYQDGAAQTIDIINVSGALDITNATLDLSNLGAALSTGSYVFATYTSLVGTEFASITGDVPGDYMIDYNYSGNSIALVVVPEPSSIFLGLGSATLLFRRRRTQG